MSVGSSSTAGTCYQLCPGQTLRLSGGGQSSGRRSLRAAAPTALSARLLAREGSAVAMAGLRVEAMASSTNGPSSPNPFRAM